MDIYKSKTQQYGATVAKLSQDLNNLSVFRLLTFVGSIALIVFLANAKLPTALLVVVPVCVLGFGSVLNQYNSVFRAKQQAVFLQEINAQEILRQENKLSDFPTGQSFINRDHNYASDFDVFGSHSLFQLINRTTTESGQIMLAAWLSEPASEAVISERQTAVKELTPNLEWRQNFQASGMHFTNAKSDYSILLNWIEQPVHLVKSKIKYIIISILLSALAISALTYFLMHLVDVLHYEQPFSVKFIVPLVVCLFGNKYFLKRVKPIAEDIVKNTQQNTKILGGYQSLIRQIEAENFSANLLRTTQAVFSHNDYSAAKEISRLKKILEIFQQKGSKNTFENTFYPILNIFFFLDIYLIILTEQWKARNGTFVRKWADAVSEFEVLSSLAGFAYSNPSFNYPEITSEPYQIRFEKLGHPLIPKEKRICNDFSLEGRGEITMITGSNMAGKSTFLRSVGVNLILALMGAPCCARSGQISRMKIFTSMRTQDNLQEGVSSFYAELKRIEQLLKLVESGEAVFFLLDEMFKGTNSEDRYKGGASLIRQLHDLNAFGIISTHDLDLAKLTARHTTVTNFSFNSKINADEIVFNYQLTAGICTDFNASELMKRSGIKIIANIDEI